MKYARNENSERLLAFLNEDGTVTFAEGATEEELRKTIRLLLCQMEIDRQRRLEDFKSLSPYRLVRLRTRPSQGRDTGSNPVKGTEWHEVWFGKGIKNAVSI